jgi:hypothetical protein
MKRYFTILLVAFFALTTQAQNNCQTPMNDFQFNRWFNQLSQMSNSQVKLNRTKIYNQNNCFSAEQIKKIASTFGDDESRLAYAENAYYSCVNPQDYFQVLDAFNSFSSAFKLYDFMVANREGNQQNNNQPQRLNFPNYDYPTYSSRPMNSTCVRPMNENAFQTISLQVYQHQAPIKKYVVALQSLEGQCYDVTQVMKIASLLDNDNHKMDYLQKAFHHLHDGVNLGYARQVFAADAYKNGFDEFIKEKNLPLYGSNISDTNSNSDDDNNDNANQNNDRTCAITENNFLILLSMIENESSDNMRLNILKSKFAGKDCFSVDQIKQLAGKLRSQSYRLDFVEIAYDSCFEKSQYFQLTTAFQSQSYKNDVLKFIEEQKK